MYITGSMPRKRIRDDDESSRIEEQDEESCTLISSQQRIQQQLEWLSAAAAKGPTSQRKDAFLNRLKELRDQSKNDSLLKKLKESYEKPLQDALTLGTVDEVKLLLDYNEDGFGDDAIVPKEQFDELLLNCLKEMVSATSYYLQLGFKAFYNESYSRFILGAACTVIELQIAYDTLMYLTNMAVYTVTLTQAQNLTELTKVFTNVYSTFKSAADITEFLKYVGYSEEDITVILDVIQKLTRAQLGYLLKGMFVKAIRWISKKEAPPSAAGAAAAPAPAPEPESFMDYLKTGRLFSLIRVPSLYAIIGEPGKSIHNSVRSGLLGLFVDKVSRAEQGVEVQLDRAFHGRSGDIKTNILLLNLLGLSDEAFSNTCQGREAYNVKCHMFLQKLKTCLTEKMGKSQEETNVFFAKTIPGINDGITEEQIQIAYGISTGPSTESMMAEPGSQTSQLSVAPSSPGWIRSMMDSWFTQVRRFVKEKTQCARVLLGVSESAAAPPTTSLDNLPHVVSLLNDKIVSLLSEMPVELTQEQKDEIKTRFERIFDTYKKTLCVVDGVGGVKILLTESTPPPTDFNFKEACKELYTTAKGYGETARFVVNELFTACFSGGIEIMECVYQMGMNPVFAGNNVFAGDSAQFDAVMKQIEDLKERNLQMIEDRRDAEEMAEDRSDAEADAAGALMDLSQTQGGGRRKSLKRGKRTRRAGRKNARKTKHKKSSARVRRNSTRNRRGRE